MFIATICYKKEDLCYCFYMNQAYLITEIGLLHRGTEKLIETNSNQAIIPYFARLDYVSTVTQEILFIETLEILISCYTSRVVALWRTLFVEFYRNLNHCLNITTHAIDIGLFTTMVWTFEEREKLIVLIEGLTGTRFHSALLLLGRCNWILNKKVGNRKLLNYTIA